ncbi:MAG: hypothetical protein R3D28_24110 [Geminicoccaceae bacterium]
MRQASGNRLTDTEAMDVLERVSRHMNQLEAQGVVAAPTTACGGSAATRRPRCSGSLRFERKQAAIMAIRRQRIDRHIATMKAAGRSAKDALLSLMHGLEGVATGIRRSAWATSAAYEQRYLGGIMGRIARDMPHVEPMLKDAAFNERVAREMEQIGRQGGRPGLTGDADARRLAEVYAEHAEMARRDANALGADIPQRQGWTPHTHDSMRLLRTTPKEWARKIKAALDLGLTFGGMSDAGSTRRSRRPIATSPPAATRCWARARASSRCSAPATSPRACTSGASCISARPTPGSPTTGSSATAP